MVHHCYILRCITDTGTIACSTCHMTLVCKLQGMEHSEKALQEHENIELGHGVAGFGDCKALEGSSGSMRIWEQFKRHL